jgi:hypothetical protein
MRLPIYEQLDRDRKRAQHEQRELTQARARLAGLWTSLALIKLELALCRKYDPNQPRVSSGNPDGGQWTSGGGATSGNASSDRDNERRSPKKIIIRAKQLNLAARSDGYERWLDLCYPLGAPAAPGSDRNKWDFHKCVDACLRRTLQ